MDNQSAISGTAHVGQGDAQYALAPLVGDVVHLGGGDNCSNESSNNGQLHGG